MSTTSLTVPQLECPATLLPTPANLTNFFKELASYAYKNEREDIKKILEDLKPIFEPYDPKFEKIQIEEIEWEIRIRGLVGEYSTYVQARLLKIVSDLTPISITANILGIEVDLIKFATDRTYLNTLFSEIDVDSVYDLLPAEYQIYKDKFDSKDFRKESIKNYFREKVKEFQTGNFIQGLSDLGLGFTLPTDPRAAAKLAINNIISDANKDIDEQIKDLKEITIGGFTVEQILGGEFKEDVEISEFQRDRLMTKLREFAEDYWDYLVKEMLSGITDLIEEIPGLGDIIEWLTFDFCKFLELIGVPKEVLLPADVQTVVNTQPSLETPS